MKSRSLKWKTTALVKSVAMSPEELVWRQASINSSSSSIYSFASIGGGALQDIRAAGFVYI